MRASALLEGAGGSSFYFGIVVVVQNIVGELILWGQVRKGEKKKRCFSEIRDGRVVAVDWWCIKAKELEMHLDVTVFLLLDIQLDQLR